MATSSRFLCFVSILGLTACGSDPAVVPTPAAIQVTVQPSVTAQNGSPLQPAPTVVLVDAAGNRVAARGVPIVAALASGTGTLTGTTEVRTDATGLAAFGDLRIKGPTGPKTLRFSAAGLAAAASNPVDLGAGAATTLSIEAGNNQTAAAGTTVAVAPAIKLVDDAGNPVPNAAATFAITQGGGVVTGGTAVTGTDGVARVGSWKLGTTVGPNQLTASAASLTALFTATATVGAPAKLLIVEGDQQSAVIGATLLVAPAVKLTDAFDNPIGGVAIAFAPSGGGTVTGGVPQTDTAGVAKVGGWVLGIAPGEQTLVASRSGVPSVTLRATAIDFSVATLSAGGLSTCARAATGITYCWGDNTSGQAGDSTPGTNLTQPGRVKSGGLAFTSVAVGGGHACGLTAAGAAYCWGNDFSGQIGINTLTGDSVTAPAAVVGGHVFASIVAGDTHTCALEAGGAAWCWGSNGNGRLGDSTTTLRTQPTQVKNGVIFTALSAGASHTCGLTAAGLLYCWGSNGGGRLGDGTTTDRRAPTQVLAPATTFAAVAAGGLHTCGLSSTGSILCWGAGTSGVLGNGGTANQVTPTAVSGTDQYQAVAAGNGHTCAITTAGAVQCWGNNGSGRLGDGTTTNRTVPTAIATSLVATAVDLGVEHSCARTQAGSAICWGRNLEGQLGDGGTTGATRPVGVKRP